jgi:hypothetical protein
MPALATLTALKGYLGVSGNNADAELQRLLDAASATVEQHVGRQLSAGARTERRHGNGRDMMLLRDSPIRSVSSLTIDGLAIPDADANGGTGYLFTDSTLWLVGYAFNRGTLNVRVTYDAGYTAIPADVQHAVIEAAAQAFKEKDWIGHQSKSLGGETVSFLRSGIPDSAREALSFYKRAYCLD